MKPVLTLILAMLSFGIFAQTDITPRVADAIKRGDANGIASFFMAQVEKEMKRGKSRADSSGNSLPIPAKAEQFGQFSTGQTKVLSSKKALSKA